MAPPAFDKRRVWITGASSGIGRALALHLAGRGAQVIASGRNEDRLRQLAAEAQGSITPLAFDVTDYTAVQQAGETLRHQLGGIDLAILNAGDCYYIDTDHFDARLVETLFQINVIGMAYCVEAALPLLRAGHAPQLAGMSSTVAYGGLPRAEAYGATKAAIRNMFQSLAVDLAAEGIGVSVICPGFVRTPLTEKNDFPMPFAIDADRAAHIIAEGLARRAYEIHFPLAFSLTFKLISSLPAPVYMWLVRRTIRRRA